VGDGEINEGPIWEGALFATHHELDNFMVIVDENGFQAMGNTQDIMKLGSIQSKFESFGFDAITIDGHDEIAINKAIVGLWKGNKKKPKALIAKTVKGKGVDFMEHDNSWHYTRLNQESYKQAILSINGSNT
jgi:transketolase